MATLPAPPTNGPAGERDQLAHDLNETVIRHLFSAALALAEMAATFGSDPGHTARLLDCVEDIDAVITHIRSVAFDSEIMTPAPTRNS